MMEDCILFWGLNPDMAFNEKRLEYFLLTSLEVQDYDYNEWFSLEFHKLLWNMGHHDYGLKDAQENGRSWC